MQEKNIWRRVMLIVIICAVAVLVSFPPAQKLKPGLDIAGGVSMIFEIEEKPGDPANLAEQMKQLLQKRVDPDGRYNLVWRVLGKNRIEVQMPLPGKEIARLKEAYKDAEEKLYRSGLTRTMIENAVSLPPGEREAAIARLARGLTDPGATTAPADPEAEKVFAAREALLKSAALANDAFRAAEAAFNAGSPGAPATQGATTQLAAATDELRNALRDAREARNDAFDAVLATNLDAQRFAEMLDLEGKSPIRKASLEQIRKQHPELNARIDAVLAAHTEWNQNRGYLDGSEDLQRLLRGAGELEFRMLAEPSAENFTKYDKYRKQLQERGTAPMTGDEFGWFKIDNPIQFFSLNSPAELEKLDPRAERAFVVDRRGKDYYVLAKLSPNDGLLHSAERPWSLRRALVNRDERGKLCVTFELDVRGGSLFSDLTQRNINKQMAILVDDVAYSQANIMGKIGMHGQITGDFSPDKVNYLVQTMQAGALPARLKDTPLSERAIGSSLGEANRDSAIRAGMIAAATVLIIMAGYYFICGLIANVGMLMNVGLTIAVMALLQAKFTLDGIAGIVLSVGMVVDANVLIYERMREEKERGASLRMMLKNGFDKAFLTIFDSNVTTLLTCIIIYYVGSEEVRSFGLTLGWGVVLNLFTSVFVTRTIFMLLAKYGLIKDIKMLKLISVPNIDWYGKRKIFYTCSTILILCGMIALYTRGARDTLDVEFLGGVTADFETREANLNDQDIRGRIKDVAGQIRNVADRLNAATVTPIEGQPGTFRVTLANVNPDELAAIIREPLEERDLLARGGFNIDNATSSIVLRAADGVSGDQVKAAIDGLAPTTRLSASDLERASVNSVREAGDAASVGRIWSLTSTETNKRLVQYTLEKALGNDLKIQPRISFVFTGPEGRAIPIKSRRLDELVPGMPAGSDANLTDHIGGALFVLDQMNPPQSVAQLTTRLRNMRLQPGFQDLPWRPFEVIGLKPAGGSKDESGNPQFNAVAIAISDPVRRHDDNPELWWSEFGAKELNLANNALDREQTLRKITQFKPQVADSAKQQAAIALILSWLMIIAYVWIRFGKPIYGVAGVIALVHDVLVALAAIGLSGLVGGNNGALNFLLIEDFKVNMTVIAALLTIIGFSINDTIVIFDRVREVRGRLGIVTPSVVNRAINECMSRTLLTTGTVLIVLTSMYIFGGSSVRAFTFCMLVGCVSGVYSTVAIAGPLLLLGQDVKDDVPVGQPAAAR